MLIFWIIKLIEHVFIFLDNSLSKDILIIFLSLIILTNIFTNFFTKSDNMAYNLEIEICLSSYF